MRPRELVPAPNLHRLGKTPRMPIVTSPRWILMALAMGTGSVHGGAPPARAPLEKVGRPSRAVADDGPGGPSYKIRPGSCETEPQLAASALPATGKADPRLA